MSEIPEDGPTIVVGQDYLNRLKKSQVPLPAEIPEELRPEDE